VGQGPAEPAADGDTERKCKVRSRKADTKPRVRKRDGKATEDRKDVAATKKAMAESNKRIPYEKVRKELGL